MFDFFAMKKTERVSFIQCAVKTVPRCVSNEEIQVVSFKMLAFFYSCRPELKIRGTFIQQLEDYE